MRPTARLGTALLAGCILVAGARDLGGQTAGSTGDQGPADSPSRDCVLAGEDFETVTALLGEWAERRRALSGAPGLALGIACGADRSWSAGFGTGDLVTGVPVTASTLFRIASISKVFTGMAVMQLRDRGALELDDPVAEHLSWFRPANADRYPPVTIRHLLTHTSGLPTNSAATDFNRMTQPVADTMIAALPRQRLVFEPGTELKYSNLGFAVLGRLIAEASGRPYAEWLAEEVLRPLGMGATVPHPMPDQPQVTGYHAREPDGTRRRADFIWLGAFAPAGGMATTARDMVALLGFLLAPGGGGPVDSTSLAQMQELHFPIGSGGSGMGLAWGVEQSEGRHEVYHGGGLPTQTSHLHVDLVRGLGAIALTNAMDGAPAAYAEEALALMRLGLGEDACARGAGAGSDVPRTVERSGAARLTGRYAWQDSRSWVVSLGGCLWLIDAAGLIDPLGGRPSRTAIRLDPIGGNRFRAASGWLAGEIVSFELDAAGRGSPSAIRMSLPAFVLRRIGDVRAAAR